MLRIANFDAVGVAIPLASPIIMSGETVSHSSNLLVRVTDCEGRAGWGEAASAPLMTGETLPGMLAAARFAADRLVGMEVDSVDMLAANIEAAIYGNPGAKCAIEMAALDLIGKRTGKPLYELIGGRVRDWAPVVRLLSIGGEVSEPEQVRRFMDAGVRAFKVKVAAGEVEADLNRCLAVRESAGPSAQVSADANEGYLYEEALDFCSRCCDYGVDFVEQPLSSHSLQGMRDCVRKSSVPIGADEGFRSAQDVRRHWKKQAAMGGSLKPLKFGLMRLMEVGSYMAGVGMHVNLAGKVAETAIGSAAITHIAVALPQLDWKVSVTNGYLVKDIANQPYTECGGSIKPTDAPGLGVTVDTEAMNSFRIA